MYMDSKVNMEKFMKENYDLDIDTCQLVIDAKKEVFDDFDEKFKSADLLDWYKELKKKHLGNKK